MDIQTDLSAFRFNVKENKGRNSSSYVLRHKRLPKSQIQNEFTGLRYLTNTSTI